MGDGGCAATPRLRTLAAVLILVAVAAWAAVSTAVVTTAVTSASVRSAASSAAYPATASRTSITTRSRFSMMRAVACLTARR